jgi:hypothetical protein
MSTVVEKQLTLTQRANEAVRQAGMVLGLNNSKALTAAMTQAALEGIERSPSFAAQVRTFYDTLMASARPVKKSTKPVTQTRSRQTSPMVELVPRMNVPRREANPGAAPDAFYLKELYGIEQLALALSRYKLAELKLAAELVQQRNPGTKPDSKSSRDALIAYIVTHVGA